MKIKLQSYTSKSSVNTSLAHHIHLGNSYKLLPQSEYVDYISQGDIYRQERKACKKIRLTCQVNVIASNVLHNNATEIVKNEGGYIDDDNQDRQLCVLNYGALEGNPGNVGKEVSSSIICKDKKRSTWTTAKYSGNTYPYPLEAIRDSQLSNEVCGYIYHPGKDFFNNHLMRSKTFRPVCYEYEKLKADEESVFNTLADFLRQEMTPLSTKDQHSYFVSENIPFPQNANVKNDNQLIKKVHLYGYDDVYSFDDALNTRLIKNFNGWYGFYNRAKIPTFFNFNQIDGTERDLQINKPINNCGGGDFIDMYPGRDLFSFTPKYNKFRHRLEKNWNYCLTYPSSSTQDLFFIDHSINEHTLLDNCGLRIYAIDEHTKTDSGSKQVVIYSFSQHGLSEGDKINLYYSYQESSDTEVTAHVLLPNAEVLTVVDEYIFTVFANGEQISDSWIDADYEDTEDEEQGENEDGDTTGDNADDTDTVIEIDGYTVYDNYLEKDGIRYPLINKRANVDVKKQRLSYKKVVDGTECEYYVRIFSKLPNFKYAAAQVTEKNLYSANSNLISECQNYANEFANDLTKLAFANNIYSDSIGQIVFTDDVQFAELKDNRGRPLTSIYLSIFKNNSGYKSWYGIGGDINLKDDTIEFSHCFGKLNCGFVEIYEDIHNKDANNVNIWTMNNVDAQYNENGHWTKGLPMGGINSSQNTTDDEIKYKEQKHFYGDLVCYEPTNCKETSIQMVMFRFNTAQRELANTDKSYDVFKNTFIDKIVFDDYDKSPFQVEIEKQNDFLIRPEGYFYCPHYEIPIQSFGEVQTMYPDFLNIRTWEYDSKNNAFTIYTLEYHYLNIGNKVIFYDYETIFYGTVLKVINNHQFVCKFYDKNNNAVSVGTGDTNQLPKQLEETDDDAVSYKLFKLDSLGIPSHAEMLKDGTCRYLWRDIIPNGLETRPNVEVYPYANNSLYINKSINLYVRRQDPYGQSLWVDEKPQDDVNLIDTTENVFTKPEEIKC